MSLVAILLATSCSEPPPKLTAVETRVWSNYARMVLAAQLRELLFCDPSRRDGVLTIEAIKAKKQLQFTGSRDADLVLKVMYADLSPDEQEQARTYYAQHASASTTDDGFSIAFGRDADAAADLAMQFFYQVYSIGGGVEFVVRRH